MRRHSDDDLYRIHSRWLGPAGWTLPVSVPMKGIPAGAVAAAVSLVVLRGFGLNGPVLWVLALAATVGAAKLVLVLTGPERPVRALAALLSSEVSAPRPDEGRAEAAVLVPGRVRLRGVPRRGRRR